MHSWILDLYRSRELLWVLVYRDIRSRTKASFLGYAWIVLQPLLTTVLFTLLIQGVLGIRPSGEIPYPVFVFAGMSVWNYFSGSLSAATESLVTHSDLLRQVSFPREVLVLYPTIGRLIDFAISLVVLIVLCVIYSVRLRAGFLFAPFIIIPVVFLSYGLALILAPLNVAARDVGKVVSLILNFAIYAVPVLYPLEKVPAQWQTVYLLNPMAGVVESFRQLVLFGQIGDIKLLGLAWFVSLSAWLVGQWLFDRFELALSDVV